MSGNDSTFDEHQNNSESLVDKIVGLVNQCDLQQLNEIAVKVGARISEKALEATDGDTIEKAMIEAINSDSVFQRMYRGGIKKIWPIGDNLFIIPTQSQMSKNKTVKSMVATIRESTEANAKECWVWDESSPTFVDSYRSPQVNNNVFRVTVHTLTPGMMVVFHNYEMVDGQRSRVESEGFELQTDSSGEMVAEPCNDFLLRKLPAPVYKGESS